MKNSDKLIGKKVKVSPDNHNENYNSFRNKTLIITHASNSGRGYDDGMFPQMLCSFKDTKGNHIPFSLYECEFVTA